MGGSSLGPNHRALVVEEERGAEEGTGELFGERGTEREEEGNFEEIHRTCCAVFRLKQATRLLGFHEELR